MKKQSINIGIIGCGWISEHAHIKALLEAEKAIIKCLYDVDIEKANRLRETYNIPYAFNNLEDFLQSGLDGVIIATPNFTHVEYTKAVLSRGIGVLCEKPVALKEQEISQIEEIQKRTGAVYVPGFVNRWRMDIQTVANLLESKTIGEINTVEAGWLRRNGVPRPGTWFTKKEYSGGGVLADLGSHVLDICLSFLGKEKPLKYELITVPCTMEKIQSTKTANWFLSDDTSEFTINVEDTAIANVTFEGNVQLKAKLSWLAGTEADGTYFKITGSNGTMELKTLFGFSNERLWSEDILIIEKDGEREKINFDRTENNASKAFLQMHQYFIQALRDGVASQVDIKHAIDVVSLIEHLYENEILDEELAAKKLKEW